MRSLGIATQVKQNRSSRDIEMKGGREEKKEKGRREELIGRIWGLVCSQGSCETPFWMLWIMDEKGVLEMEGW